MDRFRPENFGHAPVRLMCAIALDPEPGTAILHRLAARHQAAIDNARCTRPVRRSAGPQSSGSQTMRRRFATDIFLPAGTSCSRLFTSFPLANPP
jgi:hypothetical protein